MAAVDDHSRPMPERMRAGIASVGHHVTLVQGGRSPRFAYTVGLSDASGHELVLAGAASLSAKAVTRALGDGAAALRRLPLSIDSVLDVNGVGSLRIGPVHESWSARLLLGAIDFYGRDDVTAVQLVPEGALRTIDVPDLSAPLDPSREPVWRWLTEPWTFDVSPRSVAVTNLDALRGAPISEAARWEETEWELFAGPGPDVAPEDARVVPLATLLGFDSSLEPVTQLEPGQAIRRHPPGPWEAWGSDQHD